MNITTTFSTFAQAYREILLQLYNTPDVESSPRGKNIKENINYQFILTDPCKNLYKNKVRGSQHKYIANEFIWYLAGDLNADFISKSASMWNNLRNPHSKYINSNYGYLIFYDRNPYGVSQWKWALDSLKSDSDSRQAILHFNSPNHQFDGIKDFPCTLYGIFHIRNNKLNFTVHMRSNDAILGLPTDYAFFSFLHQHMYLHLENDIKNLEIGTYTHIVNSLHIYEQNFELVKNMLEHPFIEDSLPKPYLRFFDANSNQTQWCKDLCNCIYRCEKLKTNDLFSNWILNNV